LTLVLRAYAATRPGTTEVRIVADARTHYQEVISLMDAARAAGLLNAALEGSTSEGI
jgi:biopolymer transport protein ExbD